MSNEEKNLFLEFLRKEWPKMCEALFREELLEYRRRECELDYKLRIIPLMKYDKPVRIGNVLFNPVNFEL